METTMTAKKTTMPLWNHTMLPFVVVTLSVVATATTSALALHTTTVRTGLASRAVVPPTGVQRHHVPLDRQPPRPTWGGHHCDGGWAATITRCRAAIRPGDGATGGANNSDREPFFRMQQIPTATTASRLDHVVECAENGECNVVEMLEMIEGPLELFLCLYSCSDSCCLSPVPLNPW